MRTIIHRSEDIGALKTVSDDKTGVLKLATNLAEKILMDIEYREEWRFNREDKILESLQEVKFETNIQKK